MNRNTLYRQQERLRSQRDRLEAHRQQEAERLDRERQQQAGLRDQEVFERRRYMRQVQEGKLTESALQKLQVEEERTNRQKQLDQEERMAKELERIQHQAEREEKMKRYIIQNSVELRDLESKLKLAYIHKERSAQIAEHEAMKLETMREEADQARKLQHEYERAAIEQQKLEEKHHEQLVQHQRELELQLMEKELKRQDEYVASLKEKLMIDEIVRKVYEEDQMERQLRLEKVRATQQEMEEFKKQQDEWRRMEREKMEAENKRIAEFASQQQHVEESRMAKIRAREEAKEQLHKILSGQIEEEQQQREEQERVREEFYLEEQEELNRQREIEEMENKARQRLIMQQTCQQQLAFKEMRLQAERDEEMAFRRMMMAKLAEDDRLEQMNERKRRMKQLEHKREVEKLLEDRRRRREAEMELEAKAKAVEQEKEALRRQIIEEERQRLLKGHVPKLGYLPKGVLCEDDLQLFDDDFRKKFAARQADVFSDEEDE